MSHRQYAKANGTGKGVMPQVVQVQIPNINACASYHCPNCMNNIFEPAVRIFEISALLSPTGIAQPANQQVWRCTACGFAWEQASLKKLSPGERDLMIAALKAQQAEMQAGRQEAEGGIVESLPVPEGLA